MGDEIRDPKRNLPISILIGGVIAGLIYFGTTLSMLIAMPQKEIGVLSGILQAINVMSTRTGLIGVVAPLALLECMAILGTASAWFSGAARLPFVAGVDRYLPPIIGRVHPRYHTPYISLILFAILSSLLIATSFLGVSVGEAYLTMLDLAVILQLVPSTYMFLGSAQAHLEQRQPAQRQQVLPDGQRKCRSGGDRSRHRRSLYPFPPGQLRLDLRSQTGRCLCNRLWRRLILLSTSVAQGAHQPSRRARLGRGIRFLAFRHGKEYRRSLHYASLRSHGTPGQAG